MQLYSEFAKQYHNISYTAGLLRLVKETYSRPGQMCHGLSGVCDSK